MPQFDPVAAGAQAALQATRNGLQNMQSQAGAPQLPAQAQVFQGANTMIQQLSQLSPFNVLAGGDLPDMPGGTGQLPPLPALPGAQGFNVPGLPPIGGSAFEGASSATSGTSDTSGTDTATSAFD